MTLAPDHYMVVEQDVELLQRRHAGLGDGDVFTRGRRITARMVVQQCFARRYVIELEGFCQHEEVGGACAGDR